MYNYYNGFDILAQCEMCAYFAECIEGQCLCKKNYTGDGKFQCVQQERI